MLSFTPPGFFFLFLPNAAVTRRMLVSSGATVLAEKGRVNYIRIVQRWNSRSRIRWDESGLSMGRGQRRLAYKGRGLSSGRKIPGEAFVLGDQNLHKGRTG